MVCSVHSEGQRCLRIGGGKSCLYCPLLSRPYIATYTASVSIPCRRYIHIASGTKHVSYAVVLNARRSELEIAFAVKHKAHRSRYEMIQMGERL